MDPRRTDEARPRPAPRHGFDADRALTRLEDLLLALPYDRALPDLDSLSAGARLPRAVWSQDDRFLKVLHEAIVARPYSSLDEVARTRTEVELATLEVEVLTDRLTARADHPDELATISARLREVRAQLEVLRESL